MKRERSEKKRVTTKRTVVATPHQFLGLPCELWQRLIWPLCGPAQGLAWASVSQDWRALALGAIQCFSPSKLPYSKRLYASLTKSYLGQFQALSALHLDDRSMRVVSVVPALLGLTRLKTLSVHSDTTTFYADQLSMLTQLTALGAPRSYKFPFDALDSLPRLALLDIPYTHADAKLEEQLPKLTSLTFLRMDTYGGCISGDLLAPLTRLQYLSLWRCRIGESYDFLSRLHQLAFLDIGCARSMHCVEPTMMTKLTALTSLNIDDAPVCSATVMALATQLRVLRFGESRVWHARQCFGVDSLVRDTELARRLSHVRLIYEPVMLGVEIPQSLKDARLEVGGDQRELAAFRGWMTPLPPDYFNLAYDNALSLFVH